MILRCNECKGIIPVHKFSQLECQICGKLVCLDCSYVIMERIPYEGKGRLLTQMKTTGRICKKHVKGQNV